MDKNDKSLAGRHVALAAHIEKMRALFNNITPETAKAAWPKALSFPNDPTVPEAGLHKARLVWPWATEAQREESKRWLVAHDYGTTPGRPDPEVPKAKPSGGHG